MNQRLEEAIREVKALPEAEQEELARALMTMALRKKIDVELAASEAEGGEIPTDQVFRDLGKRHRG